MGSQPDATDVARLLKESLRIIIRKRILEAIGGKDASGVEAQRKRFDTFIDKAAAKEDSEELKREKKRVRFEDKPSEPEKSDVDDEVQMETDPKDEQSNEQRGAEASSSSGSSSSGSKRRPAGEEEDPGRGVRARTAEARGEKRTLEEGSAAGPEKSVKVDAVAGRWCDIVDEDWRLDPFLDKGLVKSSRSFLVEFGTRSTLQGCGRTCICGWSGYERYER